MKKIILFLLITSFGFADVFAAIETPSTQGSEFYFSFIRALPGREKDMVLTVAAARPGEIKFTDAYGTVTTKSFVAGTTAILMAHLNSVSINNPDDAENGSEAEVAALEASITGDLPYCYTIRTNIPQQRGYVVETFELDGTTPQKVSLYAGLSGSKTVDVANLYPIEALGTEYYVVSHPGDQTNSEHIDGNCEALVVATEDNTVIEITPTCLLDNQVDGDELYPTFAITLNKGETYQIRALSPFGYDAGKNDLTGTVIRVKDDGDMSATGNKCKRVAVFAGTQHGNPGDYEYEQIFPTHLWGTEYLADAPDDGGVSVVRVVAYKPCTEVNINGQLVATLNQTDYYDFVDINSTGAYVQTTKPVGVAMFTRPYQGQEGDNVSGQNNDAAMIVLAPVEQRLDSIVFSATYNVDANNHNVSIVTPTEFVDSIQFSMLVGTTWTPITLTGWTPVAANPLYSSVVYRLSTPSPSYNPAYKLISKKGGFNAYLYGYGSDKDEYGYSVGAAAVKVKTSFDLNGISSNHLSGAICIDDVVEVKPVIPDGLTVQEVRFDFDSDGNMDDTTYVQNDFIATHNYAASGDYKLTMYVFKSNVVLDCFSKSSVDTVVAEFKVKQYVIQTAIVEEHCKGDSLYSNLPASLDPTTLISNLSNTWVTADKNGVDSLMYVGPYSPNIYLDLDFGESRIYRRRTWLNNDACNIYVDTFKISIKDTIPNVVPVGVACTGTYLPVSPIAHPDLVGVPTYKWYNALGDSVANTETFEIPSNYGISTRYRRTSSTGCMYVDYFDITVPEKVDNTLSASAEGVCGDGYNQVTITATETGNPTSVWEQSYNGGAYTAFSPTTSTTYDFTPTNSGTSSDILSFKLSSSSACESIVKTVSVNVNPVFKAVLDVTSDAMPAGSYVMPQTGGALSLNVSILTQDSVSAVTLSNPSYNWQPARLNPSLNSATDVVDAGQSQSIDYSVQVTDLNGCVSTSDTITVSMKTIILHTLLIPGSSVAANTTFAEYDQGGVPVSETLGSDYKVTIFNRYGQEVFSKTGGGWDGTVKGQTADAGVYFYTIEYSGEILKGSIEVKR